MKKANWIWLQESRPNQWAEFTRSFTLETLPERTEADIAADSKYTLWVNDTLAVLDGGLNRGPAEGKGYFDRVDLRPYLKEGENFIRVLVWYWGNAGRNNVDSGHGGFYFDLKDGKESLLVSDSRWSGTLCRGYQETGEPLPSYLYGGHNIGFDARSAAVMTLEEPPCPDELGEMGCAPFGECELRPVPMMKFFEVRSFPEIRKEGNCWTGVLPCACHCEPYFKLKAPEGKKVDIRTDRYFVHGGPGDSHHLYRGHRVEYITREGEQEFEAYNWMFGEALLFTFEEGVELLEIGYRESRYDTELCGGFRTENVQLNRLMQKCGRTLLCCMRDNFMDCPDRERGQWIGDVSVQAPQVFYLLDEKAVLLMKKALSDFFRMGKDSVLRGNVPGIHAGELPSQSLCAVSEWGMAAEYYAFTGDRKVLELGFEPTISYLKLWKMQENGLVSPREGNWRWFDHLKNIDEDVLENAWYYSALRFAVTAAEELGRTEELGWLNERMESISAEFERAFWKGDCYRSGTITDDRAQAMAVLSGLAPKEHRQALRNVLEQVEESTPYMEAFVLTALCEMNCGKEALARMLRRYGPLIENENSTLWEDFSVLGTRNHAWSGGPASCLMRYAAGILPEGKDRFCIRPIEMGLDRFTAEMKVTGGMLRVEKEGNRILVSAPEGITLRTDCSLCKAEISLKNVPEQQ